MFNCASPIATRNCLSNTKYKCHGPPVYPYFEMLLGPAMSAACQNHLGWGGPKAHSPHETGYEFGGYDAVVVRSSKVAISFCAYSCAGSSLEIDLSQSFVIVLDMLCRSALLDSTARFASSQGPGWDGLHG